MSSSVPFISAEHTSCNKEEAESTSKDLPTVSAEASTSSAKANHSDGGGADAVLDNSNNNNDEMGKRKTRLEQNRISARESRKRKKVMIEELQRSVQLLNNENRLLNQQNQLLRHQLIQLQAPSIVAPASVVVSESGDQIPSTVAAPVANSTSLSNATANPIVNACNVANNHALPRQLSSTDTNALAALSMGNTAFQNFWVSAQTQAQVAATAAMLQQQTAATNLAAATAVANATANALSNTGYADEERTNDVDTDEQPAIKVDGNIMPELDAGE